MIEHVRIDGQSKVLKYSLLQEEDMYKDMADILVEKECGSFKLDKFTITHDNLGALLRGIRPGTYVRLLNGIDCVMSDTDMEKETNKEFCQKAHGDVLIGGLGIGMIIMAIQNEPKVSSITVLEKNQDVIELIKNQLPLNSKVTIINADAFTWKPDRGVKYDTIYMDIWNFINERIYATEMQPLKKRYSRYLKSKEISPNRFIKCWAEREAKNGQQI